MALKLQSRFYDFGGRGAGFRIAEGFRGMGVVWA